MSSPWERFKPVEEPQPVQQVETVPQNQPMINAPQIQQNQPMMNTPQMQPEESTQDRWARFHAINQGQLNKQPPGLWENIKSAVWKSPEELAEEKKYEEEGYLKSGARHLAAVAKAPLEIFSSHEGSLAGEFGQDFHAEEAARSYLEKKYPNNPEKVAEILSVQKEMSEQKPGIENLARFAEEKTGLPLASRTASQKALGFGAQVAMFQPGKLALKTIAGLGSYAAKRRLQETGLSEPLTNFPIAPSLSPHKMIGEKIKDVKGLTRVLAGTPSSKQSGIEAARKSLGLKPLPISETTTSAPTKLAERFIDFTGVGQDELNTIFSEFDQSFTDKLVKDIETMSPSEFKSSTEAGRAIQKHIGGKPRHEFPTNERSFQNIVPSYLKTISPTPTESDIHGGVDIMQNMQERNREYQKYFNERYDAISEGASQVKERDREIIPVLTKLYDELSGSAVESSAEKTVLNAITDILANSNIHQGNIHGGIRLSNAIKTLKSLNSIMDFEVQGGFKKNLSLVKEAINDSIDRFEKYAPEVVEELRETNAEFSTYAQNFRNDLVEPLLNPNERGYESQYEKLKKPENFNVVSHILNETPEGQKLAKSLQRDMFAKTIGNTLQTAKDAKSFSKALTPDKIRDLQNYRTTLQPEQLQQFDEFVHNSMGVNANEVLDAPLDPSQLRGQVLDSIIKQDASGLMGSLNNIENVQKIRSILQETPIGNQLWEAVSRHKLEERFSDLFLSKKQGRFDYKKFEAMLHDKDNRAWLAEVGGEKYADNLENLSNLSLELSKQFKTKNLAEKNAWGAMANAFYKWSTFAGTVFVDPYSSIGVLGSSLGKDQIMKWIAKNMADPKFVEELNVLAEAKRQKNIPKMKSTLADLEKKIP